MPYNGSGTFILAEPAFVPNTPISSSAMNSDLSDIANGLSNAVAKDGQTTITGAFKGASGSVGLPMYSFSADVNTGMYRVSADVLGFSAGGVNIVSIDADGVTVTGSLSVSATSWVPTAAIVDKAVTYQKIQDPSTTSLLLGTPSVAKKAITGAANNGSGLIRLTMADTTGLVTGNTKTVSGVLGTTEANGTWVITVISGTTVDLNGSTFTNAYISGGFIGGSVEEITLGAGLTLSQNLLSAPAFPAAGLYTNLSIKVATNTTVACVASAVTTSDGTNYLTTALSGTINFSINGAPNALDTGTIAAATWYAIWAITKADGTTAALASLSATTPTLPTDYTFKARIGWVRTAAGSAQLLGTWQFGRRAQYVLGLAQTSAMPIMISGIHGNTGGGGAPTFTATSVANFVPTTASIIRLYGYSAGAGNAIIVAPNASYGGKNAASSVPPIIATGVNANATTVTGDLTLESGNVHSASDGGTSALVCLGWEDNQ